MLGGPAEDDDSGGLVPVKRVAVRASAGPGAMSREKSAKPYFAFDGRWLKALTATSGAQAVDHPRRRRFHGADAERRRRHTGRSRPTARERLRDGIYVLRVDDALIVKRLALHPVGRRVTVQSDNPAYPDWPDCDMAEIVCIGRVDLGRPQDRLSA